MSEEEEGGGEPTNVSGQNDNPDVPFKKKKKKDDDDDKSDKETSEKEDDSDEDDDDDKDEVDEARNPYQQNPNMTPKRNEKMLGKDPDDLDYADGDVEDEDEVDYADGNAEDEDVDEVEESIDNFIQFKEARKSKFDYEIMHGSHSEAVSQVLAKIAERGYEVSDDEVFNQISGIRKPGVGKTNSYHLTITKNGKAVKKRAVFQVYNRDNSARNVPKPYELNFYIS